jgi:hypothetical protein
VFFYNGALSGSISFDPRVTANADEFSATSLATAANATKKARGEPQILLVATDGEFYGHHQPWRDHFLARLLTESAPAHGWTVMSLGAYLQRHPPRATIAIRQRTSWSCQHGVIRWSTGCACTEGESAWKEHLRQALDQLAEQLDLLYTQEAGDLLPDPWAALAGYMAVRLGRETLPAFLARHGGPPARAAAHTLVRWLESQYYRQLMLTSCATFFDDLARVEPRNSVAYAARALSFLPARWRHPLEATFVQTLGQARSWRSSQTGLDLYREVIATAPGHGANWTFMDPSPARAASSPSL